jgi:hypothetical protein
MQKMRKSKLPQLIDEILSEKGKRYLSRVLHVLNAYKSNK